MPISYPVPVWEDAPSTVSSLSATNLQGQFDAVSDSFDVLGDLAILGNEFPGKGYQPYGTGDPANPSIMAPPGPDGTVRLWDSSTLAGFRDVTLTGGSTGGGTTPLPSGAESAFLATSPSVAWLLNTPNTYVDSQNVAAAGTPNTFGTGTPSITTGVNGLLTGSGQAVTVASSNTSSGVGIDVADVAALRYAGGDFCFAMACNFTTLAATMTLIHKGLSRNYQVEVSATGITWQCAGLTYTAVGATTTGAASATIPWTPATATTYLIYVRLQGGVLKVLINGAELQDSATYTGTPTNGAVTDPMTLLAQKTSTTWIEPFRGTCDFAGLYHTVPTNADIAAIAKAGGLTVPTSSGTKFSDRLKGLANIYLTGPLSETAGTTATSDVGPNGTYVNAPTLGQPGFIPGESPDLSVTFDGVAGGDALSYPTMDLGDTAVASFVIPSDWTAPGNNNALLFEYSQDYNTVAGGLIINVNSSSVSPSGKAGLVEIATRDTTNPRHAVFFERWPAGSKDVIVTVDKNAPVATNAIKLYVDGVAQTAVDSIDTPQTGNFAAAAGGYFMSRAGTSLNAAGRLQRPGVVKRILTATEITNLAKDQGRAAPAAVTGLTVTSPSANTVNLAWTAPTGTPSAAEYWVYEQTGGLWGTAIKKVTATSTSLTSVGAGSHTYAVVAVSATTNGAQSARVTGTVTVAGPAAGPGLYVSPTGTGNGSSTSSPMSLSAALAAWTPGTIIYLMDGSYGSVKLTKSGTTAGYVIIRSLNKWGASFSLSATSSAYTVELTGTRLAIENCDINGGRIAGRLTQPLQRIKGCRIHDVGKGSYGSSGSAAISATSDGGYTVATYGQEIDANWIYIVGTGKAANQTVQGVYPTNPASASGQPTARITNNIIHDVTDTGIVTYHNPDSWIIWNNVVWHCGRGINSCPKADVRNNIVGMCAGYDFAVAKSQTSGVTGAAVHANNYAWGNGSNGGQSGVIVADPQVVTPGPVGTGTSAWTANRDMHLKSTSPCINAGSSGAALDHDFDGVARTGTMDVGAYAY